MSYILNFTPDFTSCFSGVSCCSCAIGVTCSTAFPSSVPPLSGVIDKSILRSIVARSVLGQVSSASLFQVPERILKYRQVFLEVSDLLLFFINEGRELLLKQSLYRTVVFLIIVIYFPVFSVNLFQDMTLNLIPEMESNQMFILMKNCTKIGLRLNKQMVGLTDIKV